MQQIKLRAERIEYEKSDCMIVCETRLETIFEHIKECLPQLVIIDSIQTMSSEAVDSSPGSVAQIRECTAMLLKYAKASNTPIILIGHITKEGAIAGPKILEHIVDVVLHWQVGSLTLAPSGKPQRIPYKLVNYMLIREVL